MSFALLLLISNHNIIRKVYVKAVLVRMLMRRLCIATEYWRVLARISYSLLYEHTVFFMMLVIVWAYNNNNWLQQYLLFNSVIIGQ